MTSLSYLAVSSSGSINTGYTGFLVDASKGNLTLTLPDSPTWDATYWCFIRTDSSGNTATINTVNSQTINGASSVTLSQWVPFCPLAANSNYVAIF